jgi:hypothetical protein
MGEYENDSESLIAALNTAGIRSDNHMFVRRLMDRVGASGYIPKKKDEPYVVAFRGDGLPNLRIYFGYTTGFTEDEAVRLAAALGVEMGKSSKLQGKWFVGHPVNGGFGPRGGSARMRRAEPGRCPQAGCGYELSAAGKCPDHDDE